MHCSAHDAWCSLALTTLRGLDVVTGIPVSIKWLTTDGLMCTVSAKLLITEASHGARTKRVVAYS